MKGILCSLQRLWAMVQASFLVNLPVESTFAKNLHRHADLYQHLWSSFLIPVLHFKTFQLPVLSTAYFFVSVFPCWVNSWEKGDETGGEKTREALESRESDPALSLNSSSGSSAQSVPSAFFSFWISAEVGRQALHCAVSTREEVLVCVKSSRWDTHTYTHTQTPHS